jgi:alpha,alpha-trehalase
LDQFVKEYFNVAGSDLIPSTPKDFNPSPPNFLPGVQNLKARKWALQIHGLWLELIRKVSPSVAEEPNLHTLVPLSHPVVIPGARFREAYYWDSYWVIKYAI